MNSEPLDVIPLWCFFLLALLVGLLSLECGYRIGLWRNRRFAEEKESPVAAMTGSILGLLAFMLAFTFSMAAARFDARRQAVPQEANAIGTTFLRSRLLPEPQRTEVTALLRSYAELRADKMEAGNVSEVMAESAKLHEEIWSKGVAAAEKDPGSIMTGLFLQSLNETIDLHSKRVFVGLYSRIPFMIWLSLFSLTIIGMISVGYQAGLSGTKRSPEMVLLMLAFAGVLYLNVDLDRAHEGMLKVSQQAMLDVHNTIEATQP
jgi:hypothetical protein